MQKFISWAFVFQHEAWLPILAQLDVVVQKATDTIVKTGTDIGNSNDSVRLGIISVLFVAAIAALVWLLLRVVLAQNKVITDDLRDQIKKAEEQRDAVAAVAEREREGRREDQQARNLVMQYAINEFNAKFPELKGDLKIMLSGINAAEDLLRRHLNLGPIPPRQLEEARRSMPLPLQREPPPEPYAEPPPQGRSAFLPGPPRRIAPRPHGGPREGRQTDNEEEP